MLSVPTLWTVFVINFLSLGLIWAYVSRSYPKLVAARFWTASAFAAATGAALAMLRLSVDLLLPLVAGGTTMIFAACLAAMGIRRFYDQDGRLAQHGADYRAEPRRPDLHHLRL